MFIPEYLDVTKIITTPKIKRLFDAVEEHGGTVRFVGGAVRDTLAGISGFDVDLATDLSPDELVEACQENRLKTIPIGLKIDTIGVIIDEHIFEVSSLHRYKKHKNGKYNVEYTDDWSADASQRDLTINAVYADLHGNVFDYYNGISDLKAGIVRFIGNPEDRIKEDYLRIMRFFRFHSRFGKTTINQEALDACIKLKDGLRSIAIERVRDELFKLLVTPNVTEVMRIIFEHNILGYFLPKVDNLQPLENLSAIIADSDYEGNFLRRLFILYLPNVSQAENMANTLRLTKKQKETFVKWAKIEMSAENIITEAERTKFIYRYGKQFTIDKILLTAAANDIKLPNIRHLLKDVENTIVPILPICGKDVINKGFSGNQVSKILSKLEQIWIDSNFTLNRNELLQLMQKPQY